MFLVGELYHRPYFIGCGEVKIKAAITKEDLAKTKDNDEFQVINLEEMSFFDPEKNGWVPFEREVPSA
jgi:hypothetical protein